MSAALRVSVAANLVLVGAVAVLLWRSAPTRSSPATPVPAPPSPARAGTPSSHTTSPAPTAEATTGLKPAPAAISQLEQMGLARDVIVNALLGDFHRRWDEQFAALEHQYAPGPVPQREYIELGRRRDAEQVRTLKEALGEARYLAWDKERTLRVLNPGGLELNPDEAERAYRLQQEFEERYRELQMALEDGFADGVDVGALHAQAQEARDRGLEQLLGKERFERMQGQADPIADVYRTFGELHPTPDQARAVVGIDEEFRAREAALAAQVRNQAGDMPDLTAELQALHQAREESLRRIFGAEAYEAVSRQNDSTYQRLNQFAEAWELTDQEIHSVYATLRAFRDQLSRTRSAAAMREAAGQRVDWSEVNAALEHARQQTETGLRNMIGEQRAWRLQQDGMLSLR